ncbi:hypothetical protein CEXT_10911 [Caerostris extrusa]|uniref:Uncharacterized protein n=1 Tax=Caerostris extrusa TaxID=172846 RepID=A0AAV4NSZ6_CAEEX|nr:hypothetical protein CEXT_10911 [Caerostris extrusa]
MIFSISTGGGGEGEWNRIKKKERELFLHSVFCSLWFTSGNPPMWNEKSHELPAEDRKCDHGEKERFLRGFEEFCAWLASEGPGPQIRGSWTPPEKGFIEVSGWKQKHSSTSNDSKIY